MHNSGLLYDLHDLVLMSL